MHGRSVRRAQIHAIRERGAIREVRKPVCNVELTNHDRLLSRVRAMVSLANPSRWHAERNALGRPRGG